MGKFSYIVIVCVMLAVGAVVYAVQNPTGISSLRVECYVDGVLTVPDGGVIYVNDVSYSAETGFIDVDVPWGVYTARATYSGEERTGTEEVGRGGAVIHLLWTTNGGDVHSPSEDFNLNKMGPIVTRTLPEESGHAIRGAVIYHGGRFHVWYGGNDGTGYFYLLYAEVSHDLQVIQKQVLGTAGMVPWADSNGQWTEGQACVAGDMILWAFVAQTSYSSKFWENTHIGLAIIRPPSYTTLEVLSTPIYYGDGTAGNPGLVYANGELHLFFCEGNRQVYRISTPYNPEAPYTFSWSSRQLVVMNYNPGGMITDWTPYYVDSLSRWEVYARVRPNNQIFCWYASSLVGSWTYVGNPITGGITIGGRVAQNMDAWEENVYNIMGTYYLWYGLNSGGTSQHVAKGWDQ